MLQRIQSVYLFLVFVFSVLFAILPLGHFPAVAPGEPLRIVYYRDFLLNMDISGSWMGVLLIILFLLALVVTVYATFLYKKRMVQVRLGKFSLFVHAAKILAAFFFLDTIRNQVNDAGFSYGAAIFFPIISLLFILMAIRAIRKDEELVRSADRIR